MANPVGCPNSTVHSLVVLSSGFQNPFPMLVIVAEFSGSEQTQFAASSLQRCSAASSGDESSTAVVAIASDNRNSTTFMYSLFLIGLRTYWPADYRNPQ